MKIRKSASILAAAVLAISGLGAAVQAGTYYWDSNGTTSAGAGATANGNWNTLGTTWSTDSTGSIAPAAYTTTATDDLYIVASPSATSGNNNFTITLGANQAAGSINVATQGNATITGNTLALSNGFNVAQYAYGTTNNGFVTVSSILSLTGNQTITNNSVNKLAFTGALNFTTPNTILNVTGSGNTQFDGVPTGTTPTIIKSGSGTLTLNYNAAATYFNTLTINGGIVNTTSEKNAPTQMTINNGAMFRNSAGYSNNNYTSTQNWTIGTLGGVIDMTNDGSFTLNGANASTFAGGSLGSPVTFIKAGTGDFLINSNVNVIVALHANVGVYGGLYRYSDANNTVTGKIYSADLVGGFLRYNSATNLDSGFSATVRSSGSSLAGIYLVGTGQTASSLIGSNSSGGALILSAVPTTPYDMSTLGGGKMWLGGNQNVNAINANSDGNYRLLGNTINAANILTGANNVLIGAGPNVFNGNPTQTVVINQPQNFSGTLTIAGNNLKNAGVGIDTGKAQVNLTNTGTTSASIANVTTLNIGPNATFNLNNGATNSPTYLNPAVTVNITSSRFQISQANGGAFNETINTMNVKGMASIYFNDNTVTNNTLNIVNLNVPSGSFLTLRKQNGTLGGAGAADPKVLITNFNGTPIGTSSFVSPSIRSGVEDFNGSTNNWVKYVAGTGFQSFVAGDYTDNPAVGAYTAGMHANLTTATTYTMTASASVGTIRFPGNAVIDPGLNNTLNVTLGGIMNNGSDARIGNTTNANAGSLTTSASALYLIESANVLTIRSKITGTFDLVTNGTNKIELRNSANDFVGNVYLNGGANVILADSGSTDGSFGNTNNQVFFNGGFLQSAWTTSRTVTIQDGGMSISLNSSTNAVTLNGKVTGNGPITLGWPGEPNTLSFGSSQNDFTGTVYIVRGNVSSTSTAIIPSRVITSAANVLGNNASYNLSGTTQIDLTNANATPAGFSQWIGSVEGTGNIKLGSSATLTIGSNFSGTTVAKDGVLEGIISGGGNITKTGGGIFALTANQDYTGTTTVSGGTLRLITAGGAYDSITTHGNISKSSIISIGGSGKLDVSGYNNKSTSFTVGGVNTQTLNGTGTILGHTNIGTFGKLSPADDVTIGTINITGNVTLGAGSTSFFNITDVSTHDALAITGGLAFTAGGFLRVPGSLSAGTYPLMTYTTGVAPSLSNLSILDLTGAAQPGTYTLTQTGNTINLFVAPSNTAVPSITLAGGGRFMKNSSVALNGTVSNVAGSVALNGTLSDNGGSLAVSSFSQTNFTTGAGLTDNFTATVNDIGSSLGTKSVSVIVNDPAAAPTSVTASQGIAVLDNRVVTVAAGTLSVHVNAPVSVGVTLQSTGADDQYTRVKVGNNLVADANGITVTGGNTNSIFNGSVSDGRTLSGAAFVTSGLRTGSITLTTTGEGLAGESPIDVNVNYTISVYSGKANYVGTGTSGSWSPATQWVDNTVGGNIAGTPGASGAFSAGDTATFLAIPSVANHVVNLDNQTFSLAGLTINSTTTNYSIGGNNGTISFQSSAVPINVTGNHSITAVLAGAGGGFDKTGTGKLYLNQTNTYTGPTKISQGILSLASDDPIKQSSSIVFNGGTLQAAQQNMTTGATRPVTINSGTSGTFDTNGWTLTVPGVVTGADNTASLVKVGTGTLVLSGNNNLTGAASITGGTVQVTNTGKLTSGAVSLSTGGALRFSAGVGSSIAIPAGNASYVVSSTWNGAPENVAVNAGTWQVGANANNGAQPDFILIDLGSNQTPGSISVNWDSNNTLPTNFAFYIAPAGTPTANLYNGTSSAGTSGSPNSINFGSGAWTLDSAQITTAETVTGFASYGLNGVSGQYIALYMTGRGSSNYGAVIRQITLNQGLSVTQTIGSLSSADSNTKTILDGFVTLNTGGDNSSTTFAGVISGGGSLIKSGTGTMTFTQAQTYLGATTIAAGKLSLTGTQGTSSLTVANNAALTSTGNLGLHALTLGATGTDVITLNVTVGNALTPINIIDNNGLTNNGITTFNVAGSNLQAATSYTIAQYAGAIQGAGTWALGAVPSRATATLDFSTTGFIKLNVTAVDQPKWSGLVNDGSIGDWNINTTSNWKLVSDGVTDTNYLQALTPGDNTLFDDSAAGVTTVNITTAVAPSTVVVDNSSKNYTFQGSGSIGGNTGIVKTGTGTLTLRTNNTFTGGTNLGGGTLNINSDANLGAVPTVGATNLTFSASSTLQTGGAVTLSNNRQIAVNSGVTATFDTSGGDLGVGNINGSSANGLVKVGTGTLTLNAAASYSGNTIISGGTIKLGGAAPTVLSTAVLNVDANTVSGNPATVTSIANTGTGGNALTHTGTGSTAGVNAPAYSSTALNGHPALVFNGTNALSSAAAYANTGNAMTIFLVESQAAAPGDAFAGEISMFGPGGNNNDYNNNGNFTIESLGDNTVIRPISGANKIGPALLRPYGSVPFVYSATLDTAAGVGTANLLTANGNTSLSGIAATVNFNVSTLGLGARLNNGVFSASQYEGNIGQVLIFNTVLSPQDRAAVQNYLAGRWLSGFDSNILPTTTNLQITGGATLDLNGFSQSVASLTDYSGTGGTVTNTSPVAARLSVSPSGTSVFSGTITDGAGAVAFAVNNGTQRLTGANTYSGGTTVSSAKLIVANSSGDATGTGTVYLNNGSLVSDVVGSVGGNVNATVGFVANSVSPGDIGSLGSLSIGGNLIANATTTLNFDIQGEFKDLLSIAGTLNIFSGKPKIVVAETGTHTANEYILATFANSGSFDNSYFDITEDVFGYDLVVGSTFIKLVKGTTQLAAGSGSWNGATSNVWTVNDSPNNNWVIGYPNGAGHAATFDDGGFTPAAHGAELINMDGNKRVGSVTLTSATGHWTIGSVDTTNQLIMNANGNPAFINVGEGSNQAQVINAKVVLEDNTEAASSATSGINFAGGIDIASGKTISFSGASPITVSSIDGATGGSSQVLASVGEISVLSDAQVAAGRVRGATLNIGSFATTTNATLTITQSHPDYTDDASRPSGNNYFVSVVQNINIYRNDTNSPFMGTLDITNNDIIIDYTDTDTSLLSKIEEMVKSGFNGGTWTGTGITSSVAAANPGLFTVAVADNQQLGGVAIDSFDGIDTSNHKQILVKFTWIADINLDGLVNSNDAIAFATFYSEGLTGVHHQTDDLNYDGTVNFNDAILFATTYNASLQSLPEPASLGMLAIGAAGLLMRRRRSN